ncbi:MAG: ParA family protein [Candidatus Schekmanbacteria bacterium]|nr:MAG: ParA family protein [Candidatus Schekmanbacteria bacterium]
MGKVIAVANQKGGVGKTTTSINVSACLGEKGISTLLIDLDPQGNATSGLGLNHADATKSIYRAILGRKKISEVLVDSMFPTLKVIPSTNELFGAEVELMDVSPRESLLRNCLQEIRDSFEFIIIDCPPSLGVLTVNALCASDSVLIPLQCEYYALEGMAQIFTTIRKIRETINPDLEIEGILLTMQDVRTNLSLEVCENVREKFGEKVFKTVIPRNVRLSEAPSFGKPIILYDKNSKGAETYKQLTEEIINNEKEIIR